jgi:hypothetical protein
MTRIIHERSADQKQHRLVVVLDGGTTLTSEQVWVEQAAKVSVVLTGRTGVWPCRTDESRVRYNRLTMSFRRRHERGVPTARANDHHPHECVRIPGLCVVLRRRDL